MGERELDEKLNRYTKAVVGFIAPIAIILYGSQAKGTATEYSDIDIAVIVDKIGGDILKIEAELFGLGIGIDSRIEPLLFEEGNDPSGFLAYVKNTGRIIYQQQAS
jgi:predicted nucleotidyltransferase